MAQNSKIEWTDASWNPIAGCSKVSKGCENCYAIGQAHRMAANPKTPQYSGLTQITNGRPNWSGKVSLVESALELPLHWKKPKKIFVNSMSDLFHEAVPDEWIDRIFAVMALCPQHTFQILTKRAQKMLDYALTLRLDVTGEIKGKTQVVVRHRKFDDRATVNMWPLPNVWLGVSVEDQKTADERIPLLLQTPAAVRWVSYEPALGPVDFANIRVDEENRVHALLNINHSLDWIVCGGESGPGARPMHPDWARSVRDQCQAAGVPFFFKQWGAWAPHPHPPRRGKNTGAGIFFRPDRQYGCQGDFWNGKAAAMDRVGKKAAGRMLDEREWNQFPEKVAASR